MDPVKKIWPISEKKGALDKQAEDIKKPAKWKGCKEVVEDMLGE